MFVLMKSPFATGVLNVATISDVSAAQVGSLGHAKESSKLAEGSLGVSARAFVKKSAIFISVGI